MLHQDERTLSIHQCLSFSSVNRYSQRPALFAASAATTDGACVGIMLRLHLSGLTGLLSIIEEKSKTNQILHAKAFVKCWVSRLCLPMHC